MAADPLFPQRVLALLQGRGIFDASPVADYIVQHDAGDFTLGPWNVAKLGAKPTNAQIAAITNVQANAAPGVQAQRVAQRIIDEMPVFEKAIILALIDQLNVIRSKLAPPLAAITVAQAIQAVRDKAGTL